MLNIKHILFPVDFSERTCGAAPFVAGMASRFDAKVTLLSVAQPFWYAGMGEPSYPIMFDPNLLKEDLQERLDGSLRTELAEVRVTRIAELGDPAQMIVRYANGENVDLIMMPSHGYGPFRSLLLGSVTAKVLHDAHCPVWTGAHMEEGPAKVHLACRNILCAMDGTPKSAELIRWAAQFTKDAGATLRLVHAVAGIEIWPERQLDTDFEESVRQESRMAVETLAKEAGVNVPICVAVGTVPDVVSEEARRHLADLVVIGRGIIHEKLGRLRTHAHSIVRHAPCPVISV